MQQLTLLPIDDVWMAVDCDDDIAKELSEYFSFDVPGAQHMPQFRHQHWSGKIRLFKLKSHTLYRGLAARVLEFAAARQYTVINKLPRPQVTWDIDAVLDNLSLPFPPYDYQKASVHALLNQQRGIILSPTGSGKSYILYLLACALDVKTLIVVPSVGLVEQLLRNFQDYGYDAKELHGVRAGITKESPARITVTTWQSVFELAPEYFEQYDCVMVDEVHQAKAKSLVGILEKCAHVKYRFGFTGTINDTQCHRLVLEGLFGKITKVTSTHALMKDGTLSPLHIHMLVVDYPESMRVQNRLENKLFQHEVEYLVESPIRRAFLVELVKRLEGNTLVLFQLIDRQGKALKEALEAACPGRTHYIVGHVEAEDREAIRQHVKASTGQIILATYGTMSTGTDIPNLDNVVFAHPAKSKIRVLQSIGRGLRTSPGKTHATLYDIADDLQVGAYVNHTFKHAQERMKYYAAEKFKVKMTKVPLAMFAAKSQTISLDKHVKMQ
jgi:superfamily II DNA or RNA helicase